MEDTEKRYDVIVTDPAEISFYELVEYLFDHYPTDRAEEVADEIRNTASTLSYLADRGREEPRLVNFNKTHRFILYKRTKRAYVKIIYRIEERTNTVYITDFFPTEKDDDEIVLRNS